MKVNFFGCCFENLRAKEKDEPLCTWSLCCSCWRNSKVEFATVTSFQCTSHKMLVLPVDLIVDPTQAKTVKTTNSNWNIVAGSCLVSSVLFQLNFNLPRRDSDSLPSFRLHSDATAASTCTRFRHGRPKWQGLISWVWVTVNYRTAYAACLIVTFEPTWLTNSTDTD